MGRDEHRLDDPAGARHRARQRHAGVGRAHRGRPAADRRGQARARDLRRRGRAFRGIAAPCSSATGSTPTSWARTAPASPSALVLTGIDRPSRCWRPPTDSRPTYLLGDLRELFEPYPSADRAPSGDGDTPRHGRGRGRAHRSGTRSRIERRGRPRDRPAARRRRGDLGLRACRSTRSRSTPDYIREPMSDDR